MTEKKVLVFLECFLLLTILFCFATACSPLSSNSEPKPEHQHVVRTIYLDEFTIWLHTSKSRQRYQLIFQAELVVSSVEFYTKLSSEEARINLEFWIARYYRSKHDLPEYIANNNRRVKSVEIDTDSLIFIDIDDHDLINDINAEIKDKYSITNAIISSKVLCNLGSGEGA